MKKQLFIIIILNAILALICHLKLITSKVRIRWELQISDDYFR